MKNFFSRSILTVAKVAVISVFIACGGDSGSSPTGASAKDDDSSSSSSSVIQKADSDVVSSGTEKTNSSAAKSSSSVVKSSSSKNSSSSVASDSSNVTLSSSSNIVSNDNKKSSSSSSVIKQSSSSDESSSSAVESSSATEPATDIKADGYYKANCPAGKTCTYAPTEQLNPEITYGEFLDIRDYQVYKTVTIGEQTWMAQNLNYAYTGVQYKINTIYTSNSTSWCADNVADSCAKYGRAYTWAAAIDSVALANDKDNPQTCGYIKSCDRFTAEALASKPIRGVCPSGWHLPSDAEWNILITTVGGKDVAGKALKSIDGWRYTLDDVSGNGSDAYGFSALPAGYRMGYKDAFDDVGRSASFWSATQYDLSGNSAYFMELVFNGEYASQLYNYKFSGNYIRCLKD